MIEKNDCDHDFNILRNKANHSKNFFRSNIDVENLYNFDWLISLQRFMCAQTIHASIILSKTSAF